MTGRFARLPWLWQVAWVWVGSLLVMLLAVPVGERLFGRAVWPGLAGGCAGCLLPGSLIIVLVARWPRHWTSLSLLGVAMVVRVITAAGVLAFMEFRLRLERGNSFTWLTLFYMLMLGVETVLLIDREDQENYQTRKRSGRAVPPGPFPGVDGRSSINGPVAR